MLRLSKNPFLALTYDSMPHADGIGAQTERILGVYLWAMKLNIDYFHSGITDLVEPYSNSLNLREHKNELLSTMNRENSFPHTTNVEFDSIYKLR